MAKELGTQRTGSNNAANSHRAIAFEGQVEDLAGRMNAHFPPNPALLLRESVLHAETLTGIVRLPTPSHPSAREVP